MKKNMSSCFKLILGSSKSAGAKLICNCKTIIAWSVRALFLLLLHWPGKCFGFIPFSSNNSFSVFQIIRKHQKKPLQKLKLNPFW